MMLNQTTTIINENSTLLDKLGLGGQTLLLGMLAIFGILFIIYLAIKALGAALHPAPKAEKKAKNIEVPAPAVKPVNIATTAPAAAPAPVETTAGNDSELVAVIAAAISAYTGEPVTKFRVVSFKHIK